MSRIFFPITKNKTEGRPCFIAFNKHIGKRKNESSTIQNGRPQVLCTILLTEGLEEERYSGR